MYISQEALCACPPNLRETSLLLPSLSPAVQVAAGVSVPSGEYPDLPDSTPEGGRIDPDLMAAHVDAEVVGRHFHRGSGDRHFVSVPTYPKFEGMTLQVNGGRGWGEGRGEPSCSCMPRSGCCVGCWSCLPSGSVL